MIDVKTMFATYKNCRLIADRYLCDKSPAIKIWSDAEGPIANLTVCLDDKSLGPDEAYLDTNNFPEGLDLIEKYGLGEMTGKWKASGFCRFPAVKFDMDAVAKHF